MKADATADKKKVLVGLPEQRPNRTGSTQVRQAMRRQRAAICIQTIAKSAFSS
jgi:hypothetical protein